MLNSPNGTTKNISSVIKITNTQAHARYVYFRNRARLLFSLELTHYYAESTAQQIGRRKSSWTVTPLPLDRPGSYCVLPRRPFFRQPGRARVSTKRKRRFHAPARTPSGGCSRGQCQPTSLTPAPDTKI